MRRRPLFLLLASGAVLTLLLAACGTALPVKPMSQAAATQVASLSQSTDQLVLGMISPGGFSPTSVGMQSFGLKMLGMQGVGTGSLAPMATSSCITSSPTTPVDNDGDGWPATATESYNCSSSSGGTTITVTGSVTLTDKNDSDPTSGTTASVNNLKITISGGGSTGTITENLNWDLTKTAAGSYALVYDFRVDASGSGSTAALELKGSPTYTADNAADPFAAGTFTFDGLFTYSDGSATYQLTHTSSGVHYTSTCTSTFDGGQDHYADSNGNTLDIAYSGCNSFTMTYNGNPLP